MSYKATAISTIFSPKTVKGYFIFIPHVFHSILLATSADYPKSALQTTKLTIFGNDFTIPLRAKTDNVFSVTIPEGSFSEIEFEIDTLLAKQANYGYKDGNRLATFDIFVCPYMGVPPQLFGQTFDLIAGANDTLSTIMDIVGSLMSDGMPMVTEWKTLKGCTLIEYSADKFSASGLTTIQNWNLKFHYTTISPLIKNPILGKNLTKAKVKVDEGSTVDSQKVDSGNSGVMWDGPVNEDYVVRSRRMFEPKKGYPYTIPDSLYS